MFKNMPKWMKVLLSGAAVLWILSCFAPPIGTGTNQVLHTIGSVLPAIGDGFQKSAAGTRSAVCARIDQC